MQRIISLVFICLVCHSLSLLATENPHKKKGFIPNAGQWNENVQYRMSVPNGALFLEKTGFTYNFYDGAAINALHLHGQKKDSLAIPPSTMIRHHALKMNLLGSNENSSATAQLPGNTLFNYYLGKNSAKWASGLHEYQQVRYSNIYDGTDFLIYTNESGIKYDFILQPGKNPSNIRMQYAGADAIKLQNNTLTIKTSLGDIVEQAPYAYQLIDGIKTEVACEFRQYPDGSIGFNTGKINRKAELIIDPQIIFATYSGSFDDNWGYTATYDNGGNGYSGGIAFGPNFPTTTGAYQEVFGAGTVDIGILKYNPTGTDALYITYLGGNNLELPHSLIVNEYDELIIFGTTGSTDFPVTTNAYSSQFKGGASVVFDGLTLANGLDIFVARLSSNGSALLASTYIGGTGNDGLNFSNSLAVNYADQIRGSLWVDKDNNIYVGTSTESTDFPTGDNVIQPSFGGGSQDGVILKFNGNLSSLKWATYLGGNQADGIFYLTVDRDQNVIVTGGTMSDNFPVVSGCYDVTYGGGAAPDGYVTKIDSSGQTLLASSYIGTSVYDQSYIVGTDKTNNIYLFGQTSTINGEFMFNSGVGVPQGNDFLMKLNPGLTEAIWSTTFGDNLPGLPEIAPTALLVDVCSKIYVTGWGGILNSFGTTTNGLAVTPDAFQSTTDGNDFYLYVIDNQAQNLVYASFLGGQGSLDHVDGGTSRFDRKGVIYQSICAGCGGVSDLPVTPGAFSPTNNSFNCNNALVKFDFQSEITVAAFVNADDPVGCAPYPVQFNNTSVNAEQYRWLVDDVDVDSTFNFNYTFPESGTYEVTLIATNVTNCNQKDTVSLTINVISPLDVNSTELTACPGDELTIGPNGFDDPYYTFTWTPTTGLSDPSNQRPTLTVANSVDYQLVISIGLCSDTMLTRITTPGGNHSSLATVNACEFDSVQIGLTEIVQGASYQWNPVTNLSNPTTYQPTVYVTSSTNYQLFVTYPSCASIDTFDVPLNVIPGPLADYDLNLLANCNGMTLLFTDLSTGAEGYNWQFSNGTSTTDENPVIVVPYSDTLSGTLIAIKGDCRDTLNFSEYIDDLTKYYKENNSNVFSPNADHINDCFSPALQPPDDKSFLECSTLLVFDRWGKKVFDSVAENKESCWDGNNPQGENLPEGVYFYTFKFKDTERAGIVHLKRL